MQDGAIQRKGWSMKDDIPSNAFNKYFDNFRNSVVGIIQGANTKQTKVPALTILTGYWEETMKNYILLADGVKCCGEKM